MSNSVSDANFAVWQDTVAARNSPVTKTVCSFGRDKVVHNLPNADLGAWKIRLPTQTRCALCQGRAPPPSAPSPPPIQPMLEQPLTSGLCEATLTRSECVLLRNNDPVSTPEDMDLSLQSRHPPGCWTLLSTSIDGSGQLVTHRRSYHWTDPAQANANARCGPLDTNGGLLCHCAVAFFLSLIHI